MPRSPRRNPVAWRVLRRPAGLAWCGIVAAAAAAVSTAACNNQKSAQFAGNSLDALKPQTVTDQTFPATTLGTVTTHFQPAYGIVDDQVTMVEHAPLTKTVTQLQRAVQTDTFIQGGPGTSVNKSYTISTAAKMDMIVLVDNSSSMAGEATMLANGMSSFISSFANVDWQVGILSSDNGADYKQSGCTLYGTNGLPGGAPITAKDPLANSKFISTIESIAEGVNLPGYGFTPSEHEESLLNVYQHLTGTCAYPSQAWLRPGALLTVLVLTDEDAYCWEPDGVTKDVDSQYCNQSHVPGQPVTPIAGQLPSDMISLLTPPQRPANSARFYSLTWHSSDVSCNSGAQRPANRILATVAGVGGFDSSLCATDYTSTFQQMAADASRAVQREFTLDYTPVPGTFSAKVDGQDLAAANYTLNGNILTLSNILPTQQNLQVFYWHDPTPVTSAVTLTKAADPATLQVMVSSVVLGSSDYTYSPTSGQITFAVTPVTYAPISISYRPAVALPTSFDLTSLQLTGAPLSVVVGGQPTTAYTWTPASQQLSFPTAPPDGTLISVTYPAAVPKVTTYALASNASNSNGAAPISITVTDAATAKPISVTESAGNLVFADADVINGRVVNVRYDYGDPATTLKHTLAYTPLPGSLKLTLDSGSTGCLGKISVVGTDLEFNCDAASLGDLELTYQYIAASYTTFTIDQDLPATPYIQVFVDGSPIYDYKVAGRVFTVPASDLKTSSSVHIIVANETTGA